MTDLPTQEDGEHDEALLPKSKTQVKRDIQALKTLGLQLMTLSASEQKALQLSDKLTEALAEAQQIKSHSAKKRQVQYIARLMRQEADKVDSIHVRIAALSEQQAQKNHHFHQLEKWRDRLLEGDDATLADYLTQYPNTDIQQLRQLIRNGQKEQAQNQTTAYRRKLFRYLREVDAAEQ